MDDTQKVIEKLKNQITSLKIRLRRVEGYIEAIPNADDYIISDDGNGDLSSPFLDEAIKLVVKHDYMSASLLQRKLSLGFAQAEG